MKIATQMSSLVKLRIKVTNFASLNTASGKVARTMRKLKVAFVVMYYVVYIIQKGTDKQL
jgi:hypothetical protein